jgi:hypothetical protein
MNRLRMFSSMMACSLALLFPFYANAAPGNPCRQLQRDLDRQIDDLKESQKSDLQDCRQTSGPGAADCRLLQDRQSQELGGRRAERAGRVAACRGHSTPALISSSAQSTSGISDSYFANRGNCVEYPYINCKPPDYHVDRRHHHHHHHDPQSKGTASASNGGGNSASSGGSAGHSGSSLSGSSAGGYSGGSSSHSGYTGSSGGSSGSTSSSGGSTFSGGSAGAGGSAGGGSHDSGGGRRSN